MPALEMLTMEIPEKKGQIKIKVPHTKESVALKTEGNQNRMKNKHFERTRPRHLPNGLPNVKEGYGHSHEIIFQIRCKLWQKRIEKENKKLFALYQRLNELTKIGLKLLEDQRFEPAEYIKRRQLILQTDPAYSTIMEIINGEETNSNAGSRDMA